MDGHDVMASRECSQNLPPAPAPKTIILDRGEHSKEVRSRAIQAGFSVTLMTCFC